MHTKEGVMHSTEIFFYLPRQTLTRWRKTLNPYVKNSKCRRFHTDHVVPLVNNVIQWVRPSQSSSAVCVRFCHQASIGLNTTPEQNFRENSVRQRFRDCRGLCPLICLSLTVHRYFWKQWTQKSNYKEVAVRKVCHPLSRPTSHGGHMGAYLNQQTFGCCVKRACAHVCSLLSLSLALARTHTLAFESSKSPFILQNPHTLHPVCLGTLHQHTHSLQPVHSLRHTLHRGPPSPYCPSIWLVPFVPHILLAADGKLLRAGGAAGPCSDLLKNYNMTWHLAF